MTKQPEMPESRLSADQMRALRKFARDVDTRTEQQNFVSDETEADRWRARYQIASDDWKRELALRQAMQKALQTLVDANDGSLSDVEGALFDAHKLLRNSQ